MSWSGIILVVVGALLLANNFDLLPVGWLRQWWPVLLIAIGNGADLVVGAPLVAGASVVASVVGHGRHPKVRIFKMRKRKHYRKSQGHRQSFTEIKISAVNPA